MHERGCLSLQQNTCEGAKITLREKKQQKSKLCMYDESYSLSPKNRITLDEFKCR